SVIRRWIFRVATTLPAAEVVVIVLSILSKLIHAPKSLKRFTVRSKYCTKFLEQESMSQTFWRFLIASAFLFIGITETYSQTEKGQISGQVTDPQGLVIPRAKLELTNLDTSAKLTAEADEVGHYSFTGLQGGRYSLNASADGFNPFASEDIN